MKVMVENWTLICDAITLFSYWETCSKTLISISQRPEPNVLKQCKCKTKCACLFFIWIFKEWHNKQVSTFSKRLTLLAELPMLFHRAHLRRSHRQIYFSWHTLTIFQIHSLYHNGCRGLCKNNNIGKGALNFGLHFKFTQKIVQGLRLTSKSQ